MEDSKGARTKGWKKGVQKAADETISSGASAWVFGSPPASDVTVVGKNVGGWKERVRSQTPPVDGAARKSNPKLRSSSAQHTSSASNIETSVSQGVEHVDEVPPVSPEEPNSEQTMGKIGTRDSTKDKLGASSHGTQEESRSQEERDTKGSKDKARDFKAIGEAYIEDHEPSSAEGWKSRVRRESHRKQSGQSYDKISLEMTRATSKQLKEEILLERPSKEKDSAATSGPPEITSVHGSVNEDADREHKSPTDLANMVAEDLENASRMRQSSKAAPQQRNSQDEVLYGEGSAQSKPIDTIAPLNSPWSSGAADTSPLSSAWYFGSPPAAVDSSHSHVSNALSLQPLTPSLESPPSESVPNGNRRHDWSALPPPPLPPPLESPPSDAVSHWPVGSLLIDRLTSPVSPASPHATALPASPLQASPSTNKSADTRLLIDRLASPSAPSSLPPSTLTSPVKSAQFDADGPAGVRLLVDVLTDARESAIPRSVSPSTVFEGLRGRAASMRQDNARLREAYNRATHWIREASANQHDSHSALELKRNAVNVCQMALSGLPPSLRVTILGAKGLNKTDLLSHSHAYCVCSIPGKKVQWETPVIKSNSNPKWNHVFTCMDFVQGDSLEFAVYDKDSVFEGYLGRAVLQSSQIFPDGCDSTLMLFDESGRSMNSSLSIKVEQLGKAVLRPERQIDSRAADEVRANGELAELSRDLKKALQRSTEMRQAVESELVEAEEHHAELRAAMQTELREAWSHVHINEEQVLVALNSPVGNPEQSMMPPALLEELVAAIMRRDAALQGLQDMKSKRQVQAQMAFDAQKKAVSALREEITGMRSELQEGADLEEMLCENDAPPPAFLKVWEARLDAKDAQMRMRTGQLRLRESELEAEKYEAVAVSADAAARDLQESERREEARQLARQVFDLEARKRAHENNALPMCRQVEQLAAAYDAQKQTMFSYAASLQRRSEAFDHRALPQQPDGKQSNANNQRGPPGGGRGLQALVRKLAEICGFPEVAFLQIDVRRTGRLSLDDLDIGLLVGMGLDYDAISGLSIGEIFSCLDRRRAGVICLEDFRSCCPEVWHKHGAQPPTPAEKLHAMPWGRVGGSESAYEEFSTNGANMEYPQFEELLCKQLLSLAADEAQMLFKELAGGSGNALSLKTWSAATAEPSFEQDLGSVAKPPPPISAAPDNGPARHRECALRIFAVNDVYVLDNFPRLKTLISEESKGWTNVVTTIAGDFLAPSLLSSLDCGFGAIKVMNQIPVDLACFGNHEADIPYAQLVHRIEEFNGQWLNTNMPDFKPALPSSFTKTLVGKDGQQCARTISFLGLLIGGGRFKATYREGAFGGAAANIVPVIEAAKLAYEQLFRKDPELDAVIPITHQDMAEDLELAEMGLFPAVIAGHDHDVAVEVRGESTVVKAGMDAQGVAVIDVVWGQGASAKPSVNVVMKDVANYDADPMLGNMLEHIHRPVRELEAALLYELKPQEKLSSVGVKFNKNDSMARLVATAIREVLECDAATINSGAVRGRKDYVDGVSYGDLKKECPYPSPLVVVPMPFAVLRDAVRWSRKPWWDIQNGEEPGESTGALHPDDNLTIDSNHWLTAISGETPDENRLYTVACDTRMCKKNEVFRGYCAEFPERIPPDDAGRPVLPILVDYFCGLMWDKLFMNLAAEAGDSLTEDEKIHCMFDALDADHNGQIDPQELQNAIRSKLGDNLCSNVVVEQMITIIDADGNGKVSEDELREEIRKIHHLQRALEQ